MAPFRIANLSPAQLSAIERLETQLGITLIAWEPHVVAAGAVSGHSRRTSTGVDWETGDDSALAALNESYEVGEFGDGFLYH